MDQIKRQRNAEGPHARVKVKGWRQYFILHLILILDVDYYKFILFMLTFFLFDYGV
jgi:hypothetical protein